VIYGYHLSIKKFHILIIDTKVLTVLSSCIFINIYFALFLLLRSFVHMLNNRLE